MLKERFPEVNSLRDANLPMLDEQFRSAVSSTVYNRCLYVIEENIRLEQGCALLLQNNIKGFGDKMYGSHKGLSELYEVSCKELDFLVDLSKQEDAIAGARMMGGGFGGCTINLIESSAIESIHEKFSKQYQSAMGRELAMYVMVPSEGSQLIKFD